jgi:alpha-glucosidase
LIAPQPFAETLDDYLVSFPKGLWYDFWTGLKAAASPPEPSIVDIATAGPGAASPQPAKIHPELSVLPVYVRGGSILPMQPLIQSTDEIPRGSLELRVYPGQACSGSIYLDDGHTFRYEHGDYLRQTFTCQSDDNSVRVNFGARQGSYAPWWKTIEVVIYGRSPAQADARLSTGAALKASYDKSTHALHVIVPDVTGEAELRVEAKAAR